MFRTNTIKDRVMAALETRLNALQKEYDDECVRIDDDAVKAKITLADDMERLSMNFSQALALLKEKALLFREGWNGKGMWIELQIPDENSKMTQPYIFMCVPKGVSTQFGNNQPDLVRVPWIPSQTDLMAEDWVQVT